MLQQRERANLITARDCKPMPTQQRIENLKAYCQQWQESLENVTKRRDHLCSLQSEGLYIFENDGENLLPVLIKEADQAVLQLQKILIRMQSLRDRAVNGEDV